MKGKTELINSMKEYVYQMADKKTTHKKQNYRFGKFYTCFGCETKTGVWYVF